MRLLKLFQPQSHYRVENKKVFQRDFSSQNVRERHILVGTMDSKENQTIELNALPREPKSSLRSLILTLVAAASVVIFSGCKSQTADATSTTEPTKLEVVTLATRSLPDISQEIAVVAYSVKSEQDVWDTLPNILKKTYEAYTIIFPNRVDMNPTLELLSLEEYANLVGSDGADKSEFNTIFASALPPNTVIVNKDHRLIRQSIEEGSYITVAVQYPNVFLEELFHLDIIERLVSITVEEHEFIKARGFLIEAKSGFTFKLMEEAASQVALKHMLDKMDVPVNPDNMRYRSITTRLEQLMRDADMDISELEKLHRASDVDSLLYRLYPDIRDQATRYKTALTDFSAIYENQQ